jgi:hypothetical protein
MYTNYHYQEKIKIAHLLAVGEAPLFSNASMFGMSPSLQQQAGEERTSGLAVQDSYLAALRSCLFISML